MSRKERLPTSRSTLNIGTVGYPSVLVGSVSVFHLNSNEQTYSRPRLRESTYHLLHFSGNWKDLEGTLSPKMSTLSAYLQTWRLKLSHTKMVTAAFHLNNREAKRELKVYNNGRLLPFCPTPTYLGVKLERSLTFRHHLVALRKILSSRVTLLKRLVRSGWGAGAKTPRIATLSLIHSTAEYCAPVWCRSARTAEYCASLVSQCFCAPEGCQGCWVGLTPSSLGLAQPPADWCWAIPFVHAQMGSRSFTELRVWRL